MIEPIELRPNCLLTRSTIWVIHKNFSHALGPQNSHKIAYLLREHGYPVEEILPEHLTGLKNFHGHIWCDLTFKSDTTFIAQTMAIARSFTWIDNSQVKSLEELKEVALDHAISLAESEFISSK